MVKAYEKANPSVKLDVETFDGGANGYGSIESKVALAQPGRPRLAGHRLFRARQTTSKSWASRRSISRRCSTRGSSRTRLLKSYATGTLARCYIGGKLECLRNDLAFDVLWVNVPLMKQFGYTVPTTWQQWQAIGEDVAKNHPGYVIGSHRRLV